jgi:galactose oxidase
MLAPRGHRVEQNTATKEQMMGAWELLAEDSQIAAVHAALLPSGDVVYYSGNTGQDYPAETRVWNPTGGVRRPPNDPSTDVFCSGLCLSFDGRLFVAGGTAKYSMGPADPWYGSAAAYLFDLEQGWQRLPDMSFGRWYPSAICLPDGRILVLSGEGADGSRTQQAEVFDLQTGQWETLPESANRLLPLFPRVHVLPDGRVACAGGGAATAILDLGTMEWTEVAPAEDREQIIAGALPADPSQSLGRAEGHALHEHPEDSLGPRQYDLSVLVGPASTGVVLNAGGSDPGTDAAQIIDFSQAEPAWRPLTPMPMGRWFPNSALLPDGTLLIVGGGRAPEVDPILEPVIFNPQDETWATDVPMQVGRLYHSTALLLPDGRVWVAGTDGEVRMEVYSPDYLQRGPRPTIVSAPATVTYNQTFPVAFLEGENLGASGVSFIRLSAVTHAYNSAQRYIPLSFELAGPDEVQVRAPDSPNVAPPGHYLLFVTSEAGAPSVASVVQLVYT